MNEHGAYADLHDGTSMGGSLVFKDRPSFLNVLTDIMSEAASKDALVARLNGTSNSVSMIMCVGDEAKDERLHAF